MILVNLSNLVWDPVRWRRNQAIFSHLLRSSSRFEGGLFVQPPTAQCLGSFSFYSAPKLEIIAHPTEGGKPATVVQPVFSLPRFGREKAVIRSAEAVAELITGHLKKRPFVLWINSLAHYQGHIAEHLGPSAEFRIFDGSEPFLMHERTGSPERLGQQRRILQSSDAVLCANQHVMTRIAHPVKHVFPNCTEFADPQPRRNEFRMPPLLPKPAGAVYVGFVGTLSEDRIDIDLLHSLFTRFPAYLFVFVGHANKPGLLARLKNYPNFRFVPEVSHADLRPMIESFDAAIVPHLYGASSRGADLQRVLDYLACGVPVLSTNTPEMENFGAAVYVARSMWEFGNFLERVVSGDIMHNPDTGREIAREGSWSRNVPKLAEWVFGSYSLRSN
jgi:glycosyltransferase involved in cell wall biosynthesis